ncbi:type VI secretion system Vgr family protein [Paraburkholderia megapolitana]|uniref:type VI secretion system Vgr family protein n=1 Tax=Paraburkholderia megapolitana TaxID=420953 RepID=UPI0038BB42C9
MQMSDLSSIVGLQNSRLFTLNTPLSGRSQLLVNDFSCSDELSQLYRMELGLVSQDPSIQLKQLIAQQVCVELQVTDGSTRYFNGYVTRFIHLGTDGGLATYSASVRPWLWMLGRRFDTRIFQDKNVEDILSDVFSQYSKLASYEFRLRKELKPYSYCTQYRESDLNFVRRLLEQEGLYFFFEHTKDGHKLIVTDDSQSAKAIDGAASLRYATREMLDDENVVTSWRADRQLESGRVSMKTFDYKAPGARRYVSADTTTNQGDAERYEIYDYVGLHGFDSTDRGEELTKFRLEALEASEKVFIGESNCRTLAPGRYFELTGHYDHDSSDQDDNQFLILSVSHHGTNNYQSHDGTATYSSSFVCIRKKIPFRPTLAAPRPMIAGPQTAIVVGPKGEEIYTDAMGRVKLQFHWDRLGQRDQRSSCWIRVGQPWASGGFGAIQIPRVGDEVIVSFLDGNPDRPIVISSVFNSQNMPPWKLPDNATQSGMLSRSMKGGSGNANAIRFEDKQGEEELWLQAERDMRTEVENDEMHVVTHDHRWAVGNDHTLNIKHDHVSNTGNDQTVCVGNGFSVTVGGLPAGDAPPPPIPAGNYLLNVTEQVVIQCGKSSITMTKDGVIRLEGVQIVEHASEYFLMQGKKIDLNP